MGYKLTGTLENRHGISPFYGGAAVESPRRSNEWLVSEELTFRPQYILAIP